MTCSRPIRRIVYCLSFFLAPALTSADAFDDFRVPAHRSLSWTGQLSGDGARSSGEDVSQSRSDRRLGGALSTEGFWLADSDRERTLFDWQILASGARSRSHDRGTDVLFTTPFDRLQSARGATEQWMLHLEHRHYPWDAPLGVQLAVGGRGAYQQSWQDMTEELGDFSPGSALGDLTQSTRESRTYQHAVQGSVSLGFGRVRDATGVYESRVLEQRLRERGVLRGPLDDATRRRLAALFTVRGDVSSVAERPSRRLWDAVEDALAADAAFDAERWNAEAVRRGSEPLFGKFEELDGLPRSPVLRQVGLFAGVTAVGAHVHARNWEDLETYHESIGSPPSRSFSHSWADFSDDEVLAGPMLEWHRPLSLASQIDVASSILFGLDEGDDGIRANTSARSSHVVADRWLLQIFGAYERWTHPRDSRLVSDEGWIAFYGADVIYYLEDHAQVRLTVSDQQGRDRVEFNSAPARTSFNQSGRVSLSLAYRFLGRVDAPGVLPQIRL